MSNDDAREKRLAQALRDNLRRRKGQSRESLASQNIARDADNSPAPDSTPKD